MLPFYRNYANLLVKNNYPNRKLCQNNSYPFENRLAAFILLTEQNNSYTEKHTEASEYLNVSYRHLLYVLNQFCQQNYLKKDGRTYYIQDRNQLEKLADELKYKKQH